MNYVDEFFSIDDRREELIQKKQDLKLLKTYKKKYNLKNINTDDFWTQKLIKEEGLKHHMKDDRIKTVFNMLNKIKPKKYLNIGVGDGDLEKLLTKSGQVSNSFGIDITMEGLLEAKKKADFQPIVGSILDLPINKNTIDCITILEVLEHLFYFDIFEVLNSVRSKLTKNGRLIISVPINEDYSGSYNPNAHMRRYTENIISRELEHCGFKIIHKEFLVAFSKYYKIKKFLYRTVFKSRWKPNVVIIEAKI